MPSMDSNELVDFSQKNGSDILGGHFEFRPLLPCGGRAS